MKSEPSNFNSSPDRSKIACSHIKAHRHEDEESVGKHLHVQGSEDNELADVVQPISQNETESNKDLVSIDAFDIAARLHILSWEPLSCLVIVNQRP